MRGRRAIWLLIVFGLAGVFIGNRIGEALHASVPALAAYGTFGMEPRRLALLDLGLSLGFSLRLNPAGVLGGLIALALARRV